MRNFLGLLPALLVLWSCSNTNQNDMNYVQDPHSFARPGEARVKHLLWNAEVDFDSKRIKGNATWFIETNGKADTIVFDTKGLFITKVYLDDKILADYTMGGADPILGEALQVGIDPNSKKVTIYYSTSSESEALQWLTSVQTSGGYPFLFTQSQAILARTWIPCQDSPGIRFTYEANVEVPPSLMAVMSASNPTTKDKEGKYHFVMDQPIPSYLLALAVGDLSFKSLGARTGVYAQPNTLELAASEFEDLEKMVGQAEQLYGAYRWERYDVIVLPPSFPFGGMENPRITFATPTILAGDKSLTSLIAHELAHSWSGNLVTNATWNDFWLNEGFTVYFETRIMEAMYGTEYAEMLASLNYQSLQEEINSLTKAGKREDTKLRLNLVGRNPDDGVTEIAYNKGYLFLRSIDETYGRDKFDQFLNDYFDRNAFGVMDTKTFVKQISDYYKNTFDIALTENFFSKWIYTEGLPDDAPIPHSTRFDNVDKAVREWNDSKVVQEDVTKWSTHEWLHFINNLDTLQPGDMEKLDSLGHFTASGNSEIFSAWGILVTRYHYDAGFPKLREFLLTTGRRKFLMPLYGEMTKTEEGMVNAQQIYKMARHNYHSVTTQSLDKLLRQEK